MALNFSTFKVRAISAVFFVAIMMGGLIWNNWSFFILFVAIQFGCLYEYQKLMALIFPSYKQIGPIHKWGLLLVGLAMMMLLGPKDLSIGSLLVKTIGIKGIPFILAIVLLGALLDIKKGGMLQNLAISFFGLIYIPMSLSLFFQLKNILSIAFFFNWSFLIPFLVILSIWVNDTMAYIAGSIIGRTPLSTISPNKTWEGTVAGIIIAVLVMSKVVGMWVPIHQNIIFVISLVSSIAGTFGDLFESKLKRLAGVKDSGSMMPGHGGFLDRFDSILFAVPFVWLILQFLF
jgi:phosphatidate cytidylyltransferase